MALILTIVAFWIAIPILAIFISGRKLSWWGWILFIIVWPIAWMFGPEELP